MNFTIRSPLIYALLIASVEAQGIVSGLSMAYTSVVRGGKFLRDIMYGAGAIRRIIEAIEDVVAGTQETKEMDELSKDDASLPNVDTKTSKENVLPIKHSQTEGTRDISEAHSTVIEEPLLMDFCEMNQNGHVICKTTPEETGTNDYIEKVQEAQASFDGCGGLVFNLENSQLPVTKMSNCCKKHSECYLTSCKMNKRTCDLKLRRCLSSPCNSRALDRSVRSPCRATSKLLFTSTMANSSQEYKDAQQQLKCSRYVTV